MNKCIPRSQISEIYKDTDLISLRMSTTKEDIYIHNLYIEPTTHSTRDLPPILSILRELIKKKGRHIILGDFNLHHPLWNSPTYDKHHYIADELLDIVSEIGAILYTPKGLVTRDYQRGIHHEKTTIDLLFSNLESIESLPYIREDLEQGSDHLPIETTFKIGESQEPPPKTAKRLWNRLNSEIFLSIFDRETSYLSNLPLNSRESIDYYINLLLRAIEMAIDIAVLLKRGSPHDKGFWTQECRNEVLYTRQLRRLYTHQPTIETWNLFRRQRNRKGKILSKAKRAFFRKRIEELSVLEPWSPYKWAKKREKGGKTLSIPILRNKDGNTATSIKEKAAFLREHAFSRPIEADLSDIINYRYPKPLEMEDRLTTDEVLAACLRTKPDKAPGPDGIPNRVIQLLARSRIALLERLFQACWDLSYHPRAFHKAITVFIPKEGKKDYSNPSAYRPIALLNTLGKALERIVAFRLKDISEKSALLPKSQFGARPNRSTETALYLLRERILAIRALGKIPSLLALDV